MYENLVEKYRAKSYSELIGQEKAIEEVKKFLTEFPKKKALILHGPAGTGKTSLAWIIALENNLEVLELNASDLRNRVKLEQIVRPASIQKSLFKQSKIILMDEVDGITGTDIGGIPELERIITITKFPIIMTCNDVWQSKLAPLRSISKLIEMKPLPTTAIAEILKKIAEKENIIREPMFFTKIAIKSQGDLRAAINDLQSYANEKNLFVDTTEKRDIEESIFIILRKLFKERKDFLDLFDSTKMSLDEIFLWIEENIPLEYKNEALVKAYYALGKADVFRGRIYQDQSWRFLVYQNIFQSAGISYAKPSPSFGFTKYEAPKRVLKIWLHNQKTAKKKTIAKKYAKLVHCSIKRIMRDFELLKPIIKKPEVQKQLNLAEDEIEFIKSVPS
ncbi:MAG: replication factor C large subunit [Candidatus Pacearchaeota archaeon]|nr:replication factor C large subunit [Candidatus Pacearchaeota archaeon]